MNYGPDGGPGGGGSMSSIDPTVLAAAANALKATSDGINDDIYPLRGQFTSLDVSTTHLDKLHTMAATIGHLDPELRRRISLAQAMVAEHPGSKVAYFSSDSLGAFKTVAEAQKQAKADAAKLMKNGVDDETYKDLQKYNLDPDYAEALVKELGPKKLGLLLASERRVEDSQDDPAHTVLSQLLGTASWRVKFDRKYFEDMQDDHSVPNPVGTFSEYLKHGQFSEDSLMALGEATFVNPIDKIPDVQRTSQINVLNALGDNGRAAARFFAAHRDDVWRGQSYGSKYMYPGEADAFSRFLESATITGRNELAMDYLKHPGDNPAILNAEWVMKKSISEDDPNYSHQLKVSLAKMGSEYMDGFQHTLGSSFDIGKYKDPGYDGVSVSTSDWQKFLKVGMSDNDGLGIIATSMASRIEALKRSTTLADMNSKGDNSSGDFWDQYVLGAMQQTFVHNYGEVASDRDKAEADQEDGLNSIIDTGIEWASNPSGIPGDILKKSVGALLHLGVDAAVGKEKMPDMPAGFDTKQNYADQAAIRLGADGKFKDFDDGQITWNGKKDLDLYTKPSPPCGDFRKYIESGEMNYDKLSKDPNAMRSFDDWLHNPSVQASLADGYQTQLIGSLQGK